MELLDPGACRFQDARIRDAMEHGPGISDVKYHPSVPAAPGILVVDTD